MALIKHEFPILEYDSNRLAVISPTHENLPLTLPNKAVFAFLGDHIDTYAKLHNSRIVATFESCTKQYPIYVTEYNNQQICLCQAPMGSAAATQILDWLIGYGVKEIIATGSCGALTHLPENTFLVPTKALRDEGTSYHYLPPSRFVYADSVACKAIEKTLSENGIAYIECTTWTTDGFYRETKEMVEYRIQEGCSVVEMECSALMACCQFRGVRFGQMLLTADSLADTHNYQARGWGKESWSVALSLCLEAACNLP